MLGYEFPGNTEPFTCEWLLVTGTAAAEGRMWPFSGALMLSSELTDLAVNLEFYSVGKPFAPTWGTVEPFLTLDFSDPTSLSVELWKEYGGVDRSARHPDPVRAAPRLDLVLSAEQLLEATARLRAIAKRFPPQAPPQSPARGTLTR